MHHLTQPSDADTSHSKKTVKAKNFTFTLYGVSEDESVSLKKLCDLGFAKSLVFSHETGKNNDNPHIQGYLIAYNSVRMINVKKKINEALGVDKNPHVEIARGSSVDNISYITKELKRNPSLVHRKYGEEILPTGRKRDDNKFESYVELLESGKITTREIASKDMAHYVRHQTYYETVNSLLRKKEIRPPKFVAWFAGTTGTGKTYTARRIAEIIGFDIYNVTVDNGFFGLYRQEDLALWDDYRSGPITFSKLLKLTDRSGDKLNIKGGEVWFNPYILIFTSPNGLESAKTNEMRYTLDNNFKQLERRVHFTCEFSSTDISGIPTWDTIRKTSDKVTRQFIGAFKQHLINTGFSNCIDLIPALKDYEVRQFNKLIPEEPKILITVKTNILHDSDEEETPRVARTPNNDLSF